LPPDAAAPGSQHEARESPVTHTPSGRTKSVASPIVAFAPEIGSGPPRTASLPPAFGFRRPLASKMFINRVPRLDPGQGSGSASGGTRPPFLPASSLGRQVHWRMARRAPPVLRLVPLRPPERAVPRPAPAPGGGGLPPDQDGGSASAPGRSLCRLVRPHQNPNRNATAKVASTKPTTAARSTRSCVSPPCR
jgi:hypothetical protein